MIRTVEPSTSRLLRPSRRSGCKQNGCFPVRDRPAHDAQWAKTLANEIVRARTFVDGDLVSNVVTFLI